MQARILRNPTIRSDRQGDGHFGASRGSRQHIGIDYVTDPGDLILSPVAGQVTKVGYPYGSGEGGAGGEDPYRYVEVTDVNGMRHRSFYVFPLVAEGLWVTPDTVIGRSQDLARRYGEGEYPGMTNHVHYEILDLSNNPVNPEEYVA